MEREDDNLYMQRCLELAEHGRGLTYPNPMVGSVIVSDGRIIGEGYHRKAGEDHAEVIAIESVADRSMLKEATLYVNLEPCSHYGRTPPCAARIISEGIPRVVVGTIDTSSKVAGKGIEMLRSAGCEVITGVCEEESRAINIRFFRYNELKRPYIILKWAESADGFMDVIRPQGAPLEPFWITGMAERILVHKWRAEEQAILAGGGTIRTDNPSLNVRHWDGPDPVRVIVSRSGLMNSDSNIFRGEGKVLIFTSNMALSYPNTEVFDSGGDPEGVVDRVLEVLFSKGIQSLFVEGGLTIHEMFIGSGKWDEARVFSGTRNWGAGVRAPVIEGRIDEVNRFTNSTLRIIQNEYIL
ncbi:MAG: bifunctional diaminohydroxyphosphoribosylaminopyrimidine deaminase/5-amino-6-(5-phosphoribosylamino)uracil reductase RibD [Bacteroidales bacterium]|nr:bifunctional diaminohydroxyphosphoribosylaminopyrimidine deaminase/5-amino-6-(5-phosphoribosylamino)uracil reductase RibD [Bacteroidales bacterium]